MSMHFLGDDLVQRIRFERHHQSQDLNEDLGQTNQEWQETDLFPAVRTSNIQWIVHCVKEQDIDINAVDTLGRNALQSALDRGRLTVEACQVLIELGIDLNQLDENGHTAIAKVVFFYKDHSTPEIHNPRSLELFRLMAQSGANLDVFYEWGIETIDIRGKIRSHLEMEAIVEALPAIHALKARKIHQFLKGDFRITEIVCELLGQKPIPEWQLAPCFSAAHTAAFLGIPRLPTITAAMKAALEDWSNPV